MLVNGQGTRMSLGPPSTMCNMIVEKESECYVFQGCKQWSPRARSGCLRVCRSYTYNVLKPRAPADLNNLLGFFCETPGLDFLNDAFIFVTEL